MAQPITNLAVGTKIWVSENGTPAQYEIAGFNVHGANTATLVRVRGAQGVYFGNNAIYEGSNIDSAAIAFYSKYELMHRWLVRDTSIICAIDTVGAYTTIVRKVFVPSYTEVGFGTNNTVSENAALPLYTDNSARIKLYDGSEVAESWWLRSFNSSGYARAITATGDKQTSSTTYVTVRELVPTHVILTYGVNTDDAATDGAYNIIYADIMPTATPIRPNKEYVAVDEQIEFEWSHSVDSGTDQTQADLQYSLNGGAWDTLAVVVGDSQTTTIPADTLPAGNLRWRVRTYNSDGVYGEWSDPVAFVGVGKPPAPTISSISQSSRPVVSWQSTGQFGYQVRLLKDDEVIEDSEETAGTVKQYKLRGFYPNGSYTIAVRIKNASGEWSGYSTLAFTLAVTPPATPTLTATAIQNAARLTLSTAAEHAYLLRDGVMIADVTGLSVYDDYAALGLTAYTLRAVDSSDNYADSATAYVTVSVAAPVLAAVDAMNETVPLKLTLNGPRRLSKTRSRGVSIQHYAGRKLPLATYSGFSDEAYTLSVAFLSITECDALYDLLDRMQTLLYRDTWGNKWYCIIPNDNAEQERQYENITLNMTVVDYVDAIEV